MMKSLSVALFYDTQLIKLKSVNLDFNHLTLQVRSTQNSSQCPQCRQFSQKVHSSYFRKIMDLPLSENITRVELQVRKFFCLMSDCPQKIFCERFDSFIESYGRRTFRLDGRLSKLGLLLGGNPGSFLTSLFAMPISARTLLRLIHRTKDAEIETPRILGIDDWAFKRGHIYGTILVNMETKKTIDLLPNREADSVKKWLQEHPGVEVITRDRSSEYARAAREGAPGCTQVADRWHLLKNLSEATLRFTNSANKYIYKTAMQLIEANASTQVKNIAEAPTEPPEAGIQTAEAPSGYELKFIEVKRLRAEGLSIRSIRSKTGIHRQTIKKYLQYDSYDMIKSSGTGEASMRTIKPFSHHISARWQEGERNHHQLFREISEFGYKGSFSSVYRFTRRLSQDQTQNQSAYHNKAKAWSARKAAMLIGLHDDKLTENEKIYLRTFFQLYPKALKARKIILKFKDIVRNKKSAQFDEWLSESMDCGIEQIKNFAQSLKQDYNAVKAALDSDWSNGPVEGHVNRLKMIKRQMYGSAGFSMLRKRVLFQPG